MTICRRLVELMGGRIWLESEAVRLVRKNPGFQTVQIVDPRAGPQERCRQAQAGPGALPEGGESPPFTGR